MKHYKIAVIGGTGKAGKYLVKELLTQGFPLKLLIRNPEKVLGSPLTEQVIGDVARREDVAALLQNCDAVISTLGLGQPNSAPDIFSTASQNIVSAMQDLGISRYIVITGLNVDTPFDKKGESAHQRTDWMKAHFPNTTADKQKEYQILSASDVDWTLVRLPLVEQIAQSDEVATSLEDCPGEKISATDLAKFLVRQLTSKEYIRKSPFIYNV